MKTNEAYKNIIKLIYKLENISSKNKRIEDDIQKIKFIKDILFDLHNIRIKIEKEIIIRNQDKIE